MKVQEFLRQAEVMLRNGGMCPAGRYSRHNRKQHRMLSEAYAALHGFGIKHPDSKRTARARARRIERKQIRTMLACRYEEVSL
jgi:hypothetical protein